MKLRRPGKKDPSLARKIIALMPPHEVYYDLFFGAGGMFFQKPLAKYTWANDFDAQVVNYWEVVQFRPKELAKTFESLPLHEGLFKKMKTTRYECPIMEALRFLFLSNFSLMGKGCSFRLGHNEVRHRNDLLLQIDAISDRLKGVMFRNKDFREFMDGIEVGKKHIPKEKRFIYADPVYYETTVSYGKLPPWKWQDTVDLFDVLIRSGIRFMISEFNHSKVLSLASQHGLYIKEMGERRSIEARKTEIVIANYPLPKTIFMQMSMESVWT